MTAAEVVQELLKQGPAGLCLIIMWIMLHKSEEREAKKDTRIQLLENQLTESYDERIEAAERIAGALHSNATAMQALSTEIRTRS